ncbi:MAG: GH92 family glycosyl hydrolase, partial [Micrococcales bacterium]|nr:GH92 family glycosyl hydrolase [Micrococcales bacterium]
MLSPTKARRWRAPAVVAGLGLALTGLVGTGTANAAPDYITDPASYVDTLLGTSNGGNVFPGAILPYGMLAFSPVHVSITSATAANYPDQLGYFGGSAGGYQWANTNQFTRGFGLAHVSGPGCNGASGDVPLFPMPGDVTVAPPSMDTATTNAIRAEILHANEDGEAGYYHVGLGNGVDTRLTATDRTGHGLFTYPSTPTNTASFLIRAAEGIDGTNDASVTVNPAARTVEGWATSGNFCGPNIGSQRHVNRGYYTLYYSIQFDQPFSAYGTWLDRSLQPGVTSARGGNTYGWADAVNASGAIQAGRPTAGKGAGGYITFDTSMGGNTLNVRVGISYVSVANARLNLAAEQPVDSYGFRPTFAATRAAAHQAWNEALGHVKIPDPAIQLGNPNNRSAYSFYTALYHSFVAVYKADDVNREYAGFEGEPWGHQLRPEQEHQYHTYSLWDTYRNNGQIMAWLFPQAGADVASSLLNYANQNKFNNRGTRCWDSVADPSCRGEWDRWQHAMGGTHVMVGDPAAAVVGATVAFGATNFNVEEAYASLDAAGRYPTRRDFSAISSVSPLGQIPSLDWWIRLGFLPATANGWGPMSTATELIAGESGRAVLAKYLGKEEDYKYWRERSNWWVNQWDPNAYTNNYGAGGVEARNSVRVRNLDGTWGTWAWNNSGGCVEGVNSTYNWQVQHDVAGLVEASGGRYAAEKRLDAFFRAPFGETSFTGGWLFTAGTSTGYWAHGNEPALVAPIYYNWTDAPWKAQRMTPQVVQNVWIAPWAINSYAGGKWRATGAMPGNDDLGAMSSFAAMLMMGLFNADTTSADMSISTPWFSDILIQREGGNSIHISAPGAEEWTPGSAVQNLTGQVNRYIQSVKLDGLNYTKRYLPASLISGMSGHHELEFVLGPNPSNWGAGRENEVPEDRYGEKTFSMTANRHQVNVEVGAVADNPVQLTATKVFWTRDETVTWSVPVQDGITASPASGTFNTFNAAYLAQANINFVALPNATPGRHKVEIQAVSSTGDPQRPIVIDVDVFGGADRALARTSFESGQTAMLAAGSQNPTATGWTNVSVASGTGTVGALTTQYGTNRLAYSGRATAANAVARNEILDVSGTVVPGMKLDYWIRPVDAAQVGSSQVNDNSKNVAVDVKFADGTYLSELAGAVLPSPADLKANLWNNVKVAFPAAATGKTLAKIVVAFKGDAYAGSKGNFVSALSPAPAVTTNNEQSHSRTQAVTNILDSATSPSWLSFPTFKMNQFPPTGIAGRNENPAEGWWAKYEFAAPTTLARYVVRSAASLIPGDTWMPDETFTTSIATTSAMSDPDSWNLLGSNDDVNWTLVDTQVGQRFTSRGAELDFTIDPAKRAAFKYYKLDITKVFAGAVKGEEHQMAIAHWGVYTEASGAGTQNGYANGFIDSIRLTAPLVQPSVVSANPVAVETIPFSGALGTITDTEAATISDVQILWGDGTALGAGTAVADGSGGFVISGSHTFAAAGTYDALIIFSDAGINKAVTVPVTVLKLATAGDRMALEYQVQISKLFMSDVGRWTLASYIPFQNAVNDAEALLAAPYMTQNAAAAAAALIVSTRNALVEASNESALRELIAIAKGVLANASKYVPTHIAALGTEVAAAEALLAGAPTQAQIDAQLLSLAKALARVLELGDKDTLRALIAVAETLKSADYTPETWGPLATAVAAGKVVEANAIASFYDVDLAVQALRAALNGLQLKAAKASLYGALQVALDILNHSADYVPSSLDGLQAEYNAALAVYNDANATPAAVADAQSKLVVKIAAARLKPVGSPVSSSGLTPALAAKAALAPAGVANAVASGVVKDAKFAKTAKPKIVKVGKKLVVKTGAWSPKPQFAYQWFRNGKAIAKATKATYKIKAADKGAKLKVKV